MMAKIGCRAPYQLAMPPAIIDGPVIAAALGLLATWLTISATVEGCSLIFCTKLVNYHQYNGNKSQGDI